MGVKQCIINFYKTHNRSDIMDIDYVVQVTGLTDHEVDRELRQLYRSGFIKNALFADDLLINFTI